MGYWSKPDRCLPYATKGNGDRSKVAPMHDRAVRDAVAKGTEQARIKAEKERASKRNPHRPVNAGLLVVYIDGHEITVKNREQIDKNVEATKAELRRLGFPVQ
jgi:hypothetical protein